MQIWPVAFNLLSHHRSMCAENMLCSQNGGLHFTDFTFTVHIFGIQVRVNILKTEIPETSKKYNQTNIIKMETDVFIDNLGNGKQTHAAATALTNVCSLKDV